MIRSFEKHILLDIQFVRRFLDATNRCVKNDNQSYKVLKSDIKGVLSTTKYQFDNVKSQYLTDVEDGDFTFRLMFDIKGESVLIYIYVLKDGAFLNNGLSNFGFMLNEFDLSGYSINRNFGFSSSTDLSEYIGSMISIFDDFKHEFMLRKTDLDLNDET